MNGHWAHPWRPSKAGDRTDDFSVEVQADRPECFESLIPILQGLTRFLSRFHVRQHGEKPAVFFTHIDDFSTRANYFLKFLSVSTPFFLNTPFTWVSPFNLCNNFLFRMSIRFMSPFNTV